MSLALVAAVSTNNCIGKDGQLPWHIPEDMKRFKELTMGKTVLMGRKTWESLPVKFRPLPQRKNIIITRQEGYIVPDGVWIYSSIDAALKAHGQEDIMVIGGAEIYRQTINRADTLHITHVHQSVDGDAFFPTIDPTIWREVEKENHGEFSFVKYAKK